MTLAFHRAEGRILPYREHPTILVIEVDDTSRDAMAASLSVEGFDVVTGSDGDDAIGLVRSAHPSLVLLGMQFPDTGALVVFRRIATISPVPVIMVTGRDDDLDAVQALDAGAADHVTKPLRPRELAARIRAVLRRVGYQPVPAPVPELPGRLTMGPVTIDLSLRSTEVRGEAVELSRKEFDLLALLMSESGRVVTRVQCMDRIWRGHAKGDSRTLDTHVKRLRKKIEADPGHPEHVLTVRGIGYRFSP